MATRNRKAAKAATAEGTMTDTSTAALTTGLKPVSPPVTAPVTPGSDPNTSATARETAIAHVREYATMEAQGKKAAFLYMSPLVLDSADGAIDTADIPELLDNWYMVTTGKKASEATMKGTSYRNRKSDWNVFVKLGKKEYGPAAMLLIAELAPKKGRAMQNGVACARATMSANKVLDRKGYLKVIAAAMAAGPYDRRKDLEARRKSVDSLIKRHEELLRDGDEAAYPADVIAGYKSVRTGLDAEIAALPAA